MKASRGRVKAGYSRNGITTALAIAGNAMMIIGMNCRVSGRNESFSVAVWTGSS